MHKTIALVLMMLTVSASNVSAQENMPNCLNCKTVLELDTEKLGCFIKKSELIADTSNTLVFFNLSDEFCTGKKSKSVNLVTGTTLAKRSKIDGFPYSSDSPETEAYLQVYNSEDTCRWNIRFYQERPQFGEKFYLSRDKAKNDVIIDGSKGLIKRRDGELVGVCPASATIAHLPVVETTAPKVYTLETKYLKCATQATGIVLSQSSNGWKVHLEETCLMPTK